MCIKVEFRGSSKFPKKSLYKFEYLFRSFAETSFLMRVIEHTVACFLRRFNMQI